MVSLVACFLIACQPQDLSGIDALAKARQIDAVEALAVPELKGKFHFLRGQGAFGVGEHPWGAKSVTDQQGTQYVVFFTKLTSQDRGDQVFRLRDGKLAEFVDERDTLGVRIVRTDFDLSFRLADKAVDAKATTRFMAADDRAGDFLVRLAENYTVKSVVDSTGRPVPFQQAGGVVFLPRSQSTEFTYTFTYSGVVDKRGWAGAIANDEVMLTNDYWWPSIARQPFPFTVAAHVPQGWTVVTHGVKTREETTSDGLKKVDYRMDLPISYLSFSAAPFDSVSTTHNGRVYKVWSREMSKEEMEMQLQMMPPVVEFFERFAPYPFPEFGSVVTSAYGGGALEAYSYATYGTGWLPDEDAHEPSHTWFGGILPNSYLDSFWNESFASFCESFYQREVGIGNRADRRKAFVASPRPNGLWERAPMRQSGAETGAAASAIGYGRGGYVLQQLEYEMGTAAFETAVKKWIADHDKTRSTNWEDFALACGSDYNWFFDVWLDTPGWPEFKLASAIQVSNNEIELAFEFAEKPWPVAVDLLLNKASGSQKIKTFLEPDGTNRKVIRISVDGVIDSVTVDPEGRLIPISRDQRVTISNFPRNASVYVHPSGRAWTDEESDVDAEPQDPSGMVIVGHPRDSALVRSLCQKAGFAYDGDTVMLNGQMIDLNDGSAQAVIDLGDGKRCLLKMGKSRRNPNVGSAYAAITDGLGRFMAGNTYPRSNSTPVTKG